MSGGKARDLALTVLDLEKTIDEQWNTLVIVCPAFRSFQNSRDVLKKCHAPNLDSSGNQLYRELLLNHDKNVLLTELMFLLFRRELRQVADYCRYKDMKEDAWGITVTTFLSLFPKARKENWSAVELLQRTKMDALERVKHEATRDKDDVYERYADFRKFDMPNDAPSTQLEDASYNEIVEHLKSSLDEVEYKALEKRNKYELNQRGRKIPGLAIERDKLAERRAVRKAKRLMKRFTAK